MTNLAVRCILCGMEIEQDKWTEQQLIEFVRDNGYPKFSARQLKRFRQEKVVPGVCVDHLGFGPGTRTFYSSKAGPQVLTICRLLKQTRKFDVVRFQLWREGYLIPLPVLKETICQLVPQLKWEIPRREVQKHNAVERWLNTLMQKMSGRFFRFLLKRFGKNLENLQSFFEIQLNLLYGIRVPFDEPSHCKGELSATDIFAQGLNLLEFRLKGPV